MRALRGCCLLVARSRGPRGACAVHESARKGFGADAAALYEQGRPEYSAAALDKVLSIVLPTVRGERPIEIAELGAGTGKFTGCFVERAGGLSMRYTATEPSEGFRQTLLEKKIPGVQAVFGTGEAIPLESGSVDAVVVAQAFHWMDTVETLQEVRRVLRPSGHLVLIWNTFDYRYDWLRHIDSNILTPAYGDKTPRQQTGRWTRCFQSLRGQELFHPLKEWFHSTEQRGAADVIVNRFMSTSVIVERDEAFRATAREALLEVVAQHPELQMARETGQFAIPYTTHIVWASPKA